MRITGGILKGRHVVCPPGILRPAMDRMRESVFAILGDLNGGAFLDLFSGSGIIALEAASRGASTIEAVESDTGKRAVLLANVSIAPRRIYCRFMPVELYIKRAKKQSFDFVFCDPPFPYQFRAELAANLAASPLMHKDTILMLHRPAEDKLDAGAACLDIVDRREYGRSIVDFMKQTRLQCQP